MLNGGDDGIVPLKSTVMAPVKVLCVPFWVNAPEAGVRVNPGIPFTALKERKAKAFRTVTVVAQLAPVVPPITPVVLFRL